MAQHGLGAPASRPEEDTIIIPATFDIDRDRRSWEATAAIAWATNAPRRLAPSVVERLLLDRLRLRRNDVAVSCHYPEEFLLKFERKEMCDKALKKGCIKMEDGTHVFIRPWRPLAHALGTAMPFRTRLHLEGVPAIVERVIGRNCALEEMDARSVLMTDTQAIGMWAWTNNPSSIAKVVWLTFTSRAPDGVVVAERRPTRCLRGATFRVLLHLERVEDFTSAPLDMATHDGNPVPFSPPTTVFPPWSYDTIDGRESVRSDVFIPGEFDSSGSMQDGSRRSRQGGDDHHPRDYRPRRREDDSDDDCSGRRDGHIGCRSGRGHAEAAAPRTRSRSPRRREGGSRADGGRRRAAGPPQSPASSAGCFRQMGVVALAEAQVRRVFGSRAAEERAALRADMLRDATELRRLIALPSPFVPVASIPSPVLPQPTTQEQRSEAWNDLEGVRLDLGVLHIRDEAADQPSVPTSPAVVPPSPSTPLLSMPVGSPCTPSATTSPVGSPPTPYATPLPRTALLPASPDRDVHTAASCPLTASVPAAAAPPGFGEAGTSAAIADPGLGVAGDAGSLGRFIASISVAPPSALLPTPPVRAARGKGIALSSPRRSGRLALKKIKQRTGGGDVVQELLARACGLLEPSAALDQDMKIAYAALFNTPLAALVIQAIEALAKHFKLAAAKGGKSKMPGKGGKKIANV